MYHALDWAILFKNVNNRGAVITFHLVNNLRFSCLIRTCYKRKKIQLYNFDETNETFGFRNWNFCLNSIDYSQSLFP